MISYNVGMAIVIQGLLIVWLLISLRIRKSDFHFLDQTVGITALKGYFSIIIVLFHVPVSNVFYNLLGCVSAVIIVTLFSFFSAYGMAMKTRNDSSYVDTIPIRFIRIGSVYIATYWLKEFVTGKPSTGGISWMNSLLLSYAVFYIVHKIMKEKGNLVIILFWLIYGIAMRIFPNDYFGWPAQSFGFMYGSILAVWEKPLLDFFVKRIKIICAVCILALFPLGMVYLDIHTPEMESLEMYFLRIVMSFLLILVFLSWTVRISLVNSVMAYIGKISLYIYLIHGMVIDILTDYLSDANLIMACIVLSVLLAGCFKWAVEKVIRTVHSVI